MITRAFQSEPVVTGRTLEGVSIYWDRASRVTDNGRDFYLEAFSSRSADKQLTERKAPFPLGFLHPWSTGAADKRPLGSVQFHRSAEGLVFQAVLSRTQAADEMLELVKDGAVSDVSIGFQSYKQQQKGDLTLRTEIGLRELSLAPAGMGQHEGAQVLAVRAEDEQHPEVEAEPARFNKLEASMRRASLHLWLPSYE